MAVLLKVIDERWMNHIIDMDQLRQGIGPYRLMVRGILRLSIR